MTGSKKLLIASLGTTQYMGIVFIMAAMLSIMRQNGASLHELALVNLAALPVLGKILYAYFADRYRLFFAGQYRSWLLVSQGLMALLLVAVSAFDLTQHLSIIIALVVVYALAVSVQDVAIDGLSCKLFHQNQRQIANSMQLAGNMLGTVIGGGVSLMLYPWLGWQGLLLGLALLSLISWLQVLLLREPGQAAEHAEQSLAGSTLGAMLKSCWRFIKDNRSWFLLLLISPLSFAMAFSILNPVLVDSGWTLEDIGFSTRVVGSLVGVASALCAALIISHLGRKRALLTLTLATAVALLCMLPLAYGKTSPAYVYFAIVSYFAVQPALMATYATIAMDKAARTPIKATLFSLQFSLFSAMGFVYSAVSLSLAAILGYAAVVIATLVLCLLVAAVAQRILPSEDCPTNLPLNQQRD